MAVKGIVKFKEERCKGCELCVNACPKKILAVQKDRINKQGYHPIGCVDEEACIACASCALMCPDGAISVYKED